MDRTHSTSTLHQFETPSSVPLCYTTYKRYAKYEAPFDFAIYL